VSNDGNGAGYKASLNGITAGADYMVNHDLAVGFMAGYHGTTVNATNGSTLGINGGEFGIYGMAKADGFYAQIMGDAGYETYSSQRVAVGGTATGNTNGMIYSGELGLGYQVPADNITFGPIGSLQYTEVDVNGFSESGSIAPLTFGNQGQSSLVSNLGGEVSGAFALDKEVSLAPMVSATWLNEFNTQGGSIASTVGGSAFTVQGAQVGQSGAQIGARLGLQWKSGFGVAAHYQGEFGRANFDSQDFGGEVRFGL
jgi:outer membrane autotransporter protein